MGKVQSTLDSLSLYSGDSIFPPEKSSRIFKLTGACELHKANRSLSFVELPEIQLDHVTQHENIGWGSTGIIKRCEYEGKEVAVKFLFPEADTKKFRSELQHWW